MGKGVDDALAPWASNGSRQPLLLTSISHACERSRCGTGKPHLWNLAKHKGHFQRPVIVQASRSGGPRSPVVGHGWRGGSGTRAGACGNQGRVHMVKCTNNINDITTELKLTHDVCDKGRSSYLSRDGSHRCAAAERWHCQSRELEKVQGPSKCVSMHFLHIKLKY